MARSPSSKVTSTYAWQQLRKRAFILYGDVCHVCGQPGATTLDHLHPVAAGGPALPHIDDVGPAHVACNTRRGKGRRPRPAHPGTSGIAVEAIGRQPPRLTNGPTGVAVRLLAEDRGPRGEG